ncbi:MAG: hypothetical protein EAZ97_10050 [Bacteroidetes bacterium]|nr:MAG: hypothetical protein EAZ97_10050 [Bacteroidota bacterium]
MSKKVFLGGTVNGSLWRNELIPELKIPYFNPVVLEWTDEAYQNELRERETCDFCLYVITPKMTGVYSIAEVIDDSNKRPQKTVFHFIVKDGENEFTPFQIKSLQAVGKMVDRNGGKWLQNFQEVINFLNKNV